MKASVIVAAFIAGLICGVAMSGRAETWGVATLRSYHMERGKGYNEQNYGLGIETSVNTAIRLAVGAYRNSERRDSVYAAGVYCPLYLRVGNWRGCGLAGGVTGYGDAVSPLAGAVLSYEGTEWGWNLILFPSEKGDISRGLVAFQVKRAF